MPNRAVVMSGGGSKGAFQLGALDYLINQRNLDFQVIAGVSTGSLNAVLIAQGKEPEGLKQQLSRLRQLWFDIRSNDDIYKKRFLGEILVFAIKDSMYNPEPLLKKLEREVSPDRLRSSGRQLRVGSVSLESGRYRSIRQDDPEIRKWTLASSSIPVMFPPVRIGGEACVDGGVRNITPLEDAFTALKDLSKADAAKTGGEADTGLDEMYVLLASPLEVDPTRNDWKTGLKIVKRTLSIVLNEVFREDLAYAIAINRSVQAYLETRKSLVAELGETRADEILDGAKFPYRPPKYRRVALKAIVPSKEYSEALEFKPEKIRKAFEAGQEAARSPTSEEDLWARLESLGARGVSSTASHK